jgi:hypothetical protein
MQRLLIALSVSLFFIISSPSAQAQKEAAPGKRRVFVLHSGMHILFAPADKNHAAITMKQLLSERGVAERDLIALDSPFPTASWSDIVPREGLLIYLDSTDPASRASHNGYLRLHKTLEAHKVSANDDIVWVGHSAGGQIGMSMAHISQHLDKYPELAKQVKAYHFEMVITLGSAVGSNPVPENVKLRHYFSAGDKMIYGLSKHGNLLAKTVNSKVTFRPCCDVRANGKVRVFHAIEHPSWPMNDLVLNYILHEFEPAYCPEWRRTQADVGMGLGLAQLLAKSLESEWKISLEEFQH